MHSSPNVVLGCIDCHGGNPARGLAIAQAHVPPRNAEFWTTSANPANATVVLNHESPEFIRFINPGDLRVADKACGLCHGDIVKRVGHSMMNHGAMLWNAAAYNNGAIDQKNAIVGQAYGADGIALKLENPFKPTAEETRKFGILPELVPLPRFNRGMPGNTLRIFEKGGMLPLSLGLSTLDEPPGKPERRLSDRGLGTLNRTDPIILGAQKTRLHDPMLGFMGSNDRPGDYRSSGCSACHVVYANDRSPTNSGWWSKYGHQGLSFSKDPTIPKNERGHPIVHQFTRSVPSAQCMNCHMHQGNLFVNPFLGYTWWDQETDADPMYPKEQHDPTDDELVRATVQNPEAAAARGNWGKLDFLEKVAELNPTLKHTQFADYHGHGWIFRAVFKQDKKGNRLDLDDNVIGHSDFKSAVHLNDIHISKGMQCVDCHFEIEVHGNGLLYGEPRNVTTITCIDCHGTIEKRPTLITSGAGGHWNEKARKLQPIDLQKTATPWKPRFEWGSPRQPPFPELHYVSGCPLGNAANHRHHQSHLTAIQCEGALREDAAARWRNVGLRAGLTSEMPSEARPLESGDGLPNLPYLVGNELLRLSPADEGKSARRAEQIRRRDGPEFHDLQSASRARRCLHAWDRWHGEKASDGGAAFLERGRREFAKCEPRMGLFAGSNGERRWLQRTGFQSAFPAHHERRGTTKNCTDCHLSKNNDNNAWMTSLLGFGTGTVNFFGRYAWVGGEHEIHAVVWTEEDEPQAPIGSSFQSKAYPRNYADHLKNQRVLKTAYEHHASEVNDLTLHGEYIYTANGKSGLEVFDVANIDQKGFSERFLTSPVSPLGQRTYVRTKFATAAALAGTMHQRPVAPPNPENEEQPIHPIYGYVFVTDWKKGSSSSTSTLCVMAIQRTTFRARRPPLQSRWRANRRHLRRVRGHRVYITTPRACRRRCGQAGPAAARR